MNATQFLLMAPSLAYIFWRKNNKNLTVSLSQAFGVSKLGLPPQSVSYRCHYSVDWGCSAGVGLDMDRHPCKMTHLFGCQDLVPWGLLYWDLNFSEVVWKASLAVPSPECLSTEPLTARQKTSKKRSREMAHKKKVTVICNHDSDRLSLLLNSFLLYCSSEELWSCSMELPNFQPHTI